MLLPLVLVSSLALRADLQSTPAQAVRSELVGLLTEAVDLGDATARRARARELARREGTTSEDWLAAIHALAPLELEPLRGTQTIKLPLVADGKLEETELVVFVPKAYDPKTPAPLIVAFHGTGGSGHEMEAMWRPLAEKLGLLVLAPSEAGANEGYAFSSRERSSALGALRWMRRHYAVDPKRILGTGISRGGHLTWDLALRHPDLFAAIAPMIGSPRLALVQRQNNLRLLENLVPLPIRDLQGSKDDAVMVEGLRYAFQRLSAWKAQDAKLIEFADLGHSFEFDAVDWNAFFGGARREPAPMHVVRVASRLDEARAFWIEITSFAKGVDDEFSPKISMQEWNALDAAGQRVRMEQEAEKRTARLELIESAPGRFEAKGERVERFRLLLTREMLAPDGSLELRWLGKTIKRKPAPEVRLMLEEFVERLDTGFLPVAECSLP